VVKGWTLLALGLAVFGVPGLVIGFRELGRPGGDVAAGFVELAMFALTGVAIWIARAKEGIGWAQLGLAKPRAAQTAGLTLLGLVAVVAVLAACLGFFQLVGWSYGEGDGVERPIWLLTLMIVRAGTVEELTYRSIAIDHTAGITGSHTLGWVIPGLLFGVAHYSQGMPGILIATATGLTLTALYLWKRNLWANFAIHFIVDFVPNILLPLLGVIE
jgi:membrane protease YdiL (CAAX protease family)